jgi:hypothetical protein
MKSRFLAVVILISAYCLNAQQIILMDRFDGNKVVNDSTITVFSSEEGIPDLTKYFTMKNNTAQPLAVFLRKTINIIADSTTDYYCFGIRCWPGDDSTNIADSIPPGGEDYTFASHVTHKRRFDIPQPILPPGLSSITYTVYDKTSFPEPVEASVTVIYHHSGLGIRDDEKGNIEAVVYPNPAWDKITVETSERRPGKYTLILYNSLGTEVQKAIVRVQENELTIPVNHFKSGLYYGKLVSDNGKITCFKFQVAQSCY